MRSCVQFTQNALDLCLDGDISKTRPRRTRIDVARWSGTCATGWQAVDPQGGGADFRICPLAQSPTFAIRPLDSAKPQHRDAAVITELPSLNTLFQFVQHVIRNIQVAAQAGSQTDHRLVGSVEIRTASCRQIETLRQ
jgi:hypothetical protein